MGKLQSCSVIVLLSLVQLFVLSQAKDEDLKCGVCRAVVSEINLSIRSADPKKKVQVGSFRVDSKGNQQTKDIPLSRSESYIGEAFEKLCERMPQWGVLKDKNQRRAVIRKYNMEGSLVEGLDKEAHKRLTSLCYEFVEEHEEDAIPIFQVDGSSNDQHEKELCIGLLGVCTAAEIKYQAEAQSQGIRDAIMSQANAGKDTINVNPGAGAPADDDDDDDFDDDDDDADEEKKEESEKQKEEDETVADDKDEL